MRFAVSAVAAATGMLLLGMALFGQPELYLRQAREVWDNLTDSPPAPSEIAPVGRAPEIAPVALAPAAAAPDAAPVVPAPAPSAPEAASSALEVPPASLEPAPAASTIQPNAEVNAKVEQLQQQVLQLRDELAARREEADRTREALVAAQAQRVAAEAQRLAAEQVPATQPEPATNQLQNGIETPPPAAADRRGVPPKPTVSPAKPAPRQEADNAQSVLARLRQAAPATATQPNAAQPSERGNRGPSTVLRRLIAARAALANGQVEETRRLLQEAQLQLVFRPVGSADADSGSPSRTASDVARALDALSGNDLPLSRSYLGRAVDDASGPPADLARGEAGEPAPGYAPAYPVR